MPDFCPLKFSLKKLASHTDFITRCIKKTCVVLKILDHRTDYVNRSSNRLRLMNCFDRYRPFHLATLWKKHFFFCGKSFSSRARTISTVTFQQKKGVCRWKFVTTLQKKVFDKSELWAFLNFIKPGSHLRHNDITTLT